MEAREWFTTDQAAEYLGVSKRTVYRLCKEGRLATYVLGNHRTRRFTKVDLDSVPRPLGAPVPRKRHRGINLAEGPVLAELWENEEDAAYDAI